MVRSIAAALTRTRDEPLTDILGGIWLVTVLFGLMQLPTLLS